MKVPSIALVVLVAALVGCRPDEQKAGDISREDVREARAGLDASARARLDSGNAVFRLAREASERGEGGRADSLYRASLPYYREAVRLDDDAAAPGWFGIYMAERALGNTAAAQEAMERARDAAPGATLMHPEEEEPATSDTAAP